MSNQKSKIAIVGLLIIIGIAALSVGLSRKSNPKPVTSSTPSAQVQQSPKNEVSYPGIESKNALELLKQTHKVETKSYEGLGELVTSIDGVTADSKHFWSFYVNDQQAQVGAGTYVTKATDKITWKLEEIK